MDFGYWNAGAGGVTGKSCDKGGTDCNYYQGWNGSHPDGQSVECTMDSCLKVGISAEGASKNYTSIRSYSTCVWN